MESDAHKIMRFQFRPLLGKNPSNKSQDNGKNPIQNMFTESENQCGFQKHIYINELCDII